MKEPFKEVMAIRGLPLPEDNEVTISGEDPVLHRVLNLVKRQQVSWQELALQSRIYMNSKLGDVRQ